MRKLLVTLVIACSLSSSAEPALEIQVSYTEQIDEAFANELSSLLNNALHVVRLFPPFENEHNLFNWQRDRQILAGKKFRIFLSTTKDPDLLPIISNSRSRNLDAFTLVGLNTTNKSMDLMTVLLVDQLFYNPQGREYSDGYARLVVALAHEIYGNVQTYLDFKIESAQKQTHATRIEQELKAFRASLAFLGRLTLDPKFATLPHQTRVNLINRIPFEIEAYRSWLKAHPSETPDPVCETLLRSLKNGTG